jgi:hypothetical protein
MVHWYFCTKEALCRKNRKNREPVVVERVQTGVRMEKRMLKVLKAVAELKEMTLGDLLEGIVLHAFEGKLVPFSAQTLKEIEQFKSIYGMTLKASDSHNLKERKPPAGGRRLRPGDLKSYCKTSTSGISLSVSSQN